MQAARPLLRILGLGFGLALVFGNMIGVGILRLPGMVAASLGDRWLILLFWALGGLYALIGAVAVAELAAMIPETGGFRVYVRRAFGERFGFAIGWCDWLQRGRSGVGRSHGGRISRRPVAGRYDSPARGCHCDTRGVYRGPLDGPAHRELADEPGQHCGRTHAYGPGRPVLSRRSSQVEVGIVTGVRHPRRDPRWARRTGQLKPSTYS